jgi:cytochrome c oxidase subunit 4
VLIALILLTASTIAVSFVHLPGSWHVGIGLAIAASKAALVALIFMHLWRSSRLTWMVVDVTAFWLIAVLLTLTFSDYLTRGNVPGH